MSRNFIRIQWILEADNNEEVPDSDIAMHIFEDFFKMTQILNKKVARSQHSTAKDKIKDWIFCQHDDNFKK